MRTVFLAMHRAVKAMWIVLSSVVTPSRSPNKQTKGEAGIEHLRHFDKSSQIHNAIPVHYQQCHCSILVTCKLATEMAEQQFIF